MAFTSRQQEIIDTSVKLIAERGIQALTMKNLSNTIGISEPAIYRHFENKMEILLGILSFFEQNNRLLFESVIKSNIRAIDKLEAVFLQHFKEFKANPALSVALFSEEMFHSDDHLTRKVFHIMNSVQSHILSILQEGYEKNSFRKDIPAQHMAILIMGTLRLLVTRWRLSNFEFDLEDEGIKLLTSLKKIIQREP
jgi:AcrR family transcriptional regulator